MDFFIINLLPCFFPITAETTQDPCQELVPN